MAASPEIHFAAPNIKGFVAAECIPRSARHIGASQSAFMPWICQGLAAEPGEPPPITRELGVSEAILGAPAATCATTKPLSEPA